jgi:hypothetical protein
MLFDLAVGLKRKLDKVSNPAQPMTAALDYLSPWHFRYAKAGFPSPA